MLHPVVIVMCAELRTLRKAAGLSQAELGALIGVSRWKIMRWESERNREKEIPPHWARYIRDVLREQGYLRKR